MLALASDQLSARAARGLARTDTWSRTGSSDRGVWGHCQGSRSTPYQTAVALTGPAYRCSCPSRKLPCKHALGLLLLWSNGTVRPADEPEWAADWLARPDQAEPRRRGAVVDPEAAKARAERRADRVAGGVAELRTWLNDRMHRGLAGFDQQGWTELNRLAARMVDAQAPGLAGSLRRAAGTIGRGEGWPGRLLEELSMVHLAAAAHDRLGELPGPLAETVRTRIGWTTGTEQVLSAGEKVEDDWLVLGQVLEPDERLTVRRIWLRGMRTERTGLLLSFAANGQALEVPPAGPGEVVRAVASFYPGGVRALLVPPTDESPSDGGPGRGNGALAGAIASARAPEGMPAGEIGPGLGAAGVEPRAWPAGVSVAGALAEVAAALGVDPWLERWPVVLAGIRPARDGDGWAVVDADGDGLGLVPYVDPWALLATSAGAPLTVAAELGRDGLLRPMTGWEGDRVVVLA